MLNSGIDYEIAVLIMCNQVCKSFDELEGVLYRR